MSLAELCDFYSLCDCEGTSVTVGLPGHVACVLSTAQASPPCHQQSTPAECPGDPRALVGATASFVGQVYSVGLELPVLRLDSFLPPGALLLGGGFLRGYLLAGSSSLKNRTFLKPCVLLYLLSCSSLLSQGF